MGKDKQAKSKGYDFKEVEAKVVEFWDTEKIYKTDFKKKNYTIDTPPPTVSGNMHIGHAFSYSQQDFIARYRRMKEGVFYPFGTDDNGLPTERLVERLKKVKSTDMSRSEFIDLCLKTISEIRDDFINDWRILGVSADFENCYSTIDENSRRISQKSFIDLYNKENIYKKEFPTLWCPECQTAIAQAELEDKELPSKFSTIIFTLKESGKELHIATTRPELLSACVAIFVNPKDDRYKDMIGKKVIVPLFHQEVEVIADESADIEKGTGVLMICSYGDKFDVEAVQKYKLNPKIVFNADGTAKFEGYEGLSITDTRKKVLSDLKHADLIVEQKDITHAVNVHDKCGTEIEFYPTAQWFINIIDKKKDLIAQGNKIKWYPEFMHKRFDSWIEGLDWDWNISRNRHFGVPIPVWECEKCNNVILPEEKELPVDPTQTHKKCETCGIDATGESMVLDTWATSSLTPRITNNLAHQNITSPYSLRPQGHDIIRTWAFYTVVQSYLHDNDIPWKDIVISGMVTRKGEKMGKSKGNSISPQEVLEQYGADVLRFWTSGSTLGSDLDYHEEDLIAGKKTVNKLWNAAKFVFMNLEGYDGKAKPKKLEALDSAFLKKLEHAQHEATEHFEKYEYSRAKQVIETFFWKDFTDNYLEIVKKRVYQGEGDKKLSAQYTLYQTLHAITKLFAPIMPFVTEEMYQTYFKTIEKGDSIHTSSWDAGKKHTEKDFDNLHLLYKTLSDVRSEKTKMKVSMNHEITLTLPKDAFDTLTKAGMMEDLKHVTCAKEVKKDGAFHVI